MGLVDWLILLLVGVSTLLSARRGFVKEALSLGSWIGGLVVVRFFALPMAGLLEPFIESNVARLVLACFMLFVMVLAVGGMVSQLLGDFVRLTGLVGTDRFLGICFGALRGLVIVLIILAALVWLAPGLLEEDWWNESLLIEELMRLVEWLLPSIRDQGAALLGGAR